jgi:AGCS family alanine or glycine:cation symporter
MAFMATINLIALAFLGPIAFKVLRNYLEQRKRGKDPVFYADSVPGLGELEAWEKEPEKDEQRVS